ncbi:MAG TPA: MarR family transcriptional regulator [Gammaproteobacteria bacterium]|nr:MarR family transcriptional regulator [Gammaproteobacteria bacterium]
MDNQLKPMGMSQARWMVLFTLSQRGEGIAQRDLAAYLSIEGPTLVRILNKLESEGWVERRNHPEDKRCKLVYLCEKANPILDQITGTAAKLREQLLHGIPTENLATCLNVMETIKSRLESMNK